MKTNDTSSNFLLTCVLLFAGIDITGILDYGLKAVVGGAIWFGYKMAADYLIEKKKQKNNEAGKINA